MQNSDGYVPAPDIFKLVKKFPFGQTLVRFIKSYPGLEIVGEDFFFYHVRAKETGWTMMEKGEGWTYFVNPLDTILIRQFHQDGGGDWIGIIIIPPDLMIPRHFPNGEDVRPFVEYRFGFKIINEFNDYYAVVTPEKGWKTRKEGHWIYFSDPTGRVRFQEYNYWQFTDKALFFPMGFP